MMYRTMQPSCRKARSGKALSGQPILVNSATYHAFLVSFQVALIPTTKTGQSETTRPIHSIQRFGVASRTGTATELIYVFPPYARGAASSRVADSVMAVV